MLRGAHRCCSSTSAASAACRAVLFMRSSQAPSLSYCQHAGCDVAADPGMACGSDFLAAQPCAAANVQQQRLPPNLQVQGGTTQSLLWMHDVRVEPERAYVKLH